MDRTRASPAAQSNGYIRRDNGKAPRTTRGFTCEAVATALTGIDTLYSSGESAMVVVARPLPQAMSPGGPESRLPREE